MARAKTNGKGWHKDSARHSRARKYGKAGGKYANERIQKILQKNPEYKNLTYKQLRNKGIFLRYQSDSDKDGVKNVKDCKPLNKEEQDLKEDIKKIEEGTISLIKKGVKKAEKLGEKGLEKAKELTRQAKTKIAEIQAEKKRKQEETIVRAITKARNEKLIPEATEEEIRAKVEAEVHKETAKRETEFVPVEQIFLKPEIEPEEAQKIAERTAEAIRKAKRTRIDDLSQIDLAELTDEELKEIAINLGTGFFGAGNRYEEELKRRIREKEKIETDLKIETMKAEKTAQERIKQITKEGVSKGGYIWDDWFK